MNSIQLKIHFALFALLVYLYSTVAQPSLVILPNDDKVSVRLKEPFSLKCKPAGDNPTLFADIRWNGPNAENNWQELEKRHKVVRSSLDGSAKLIFNSSIANLDDSGVYYCSTSYHSTDVLKNKIEVEFYAPIEVQECDENQFVVLDQSDAKISCSVTSLPGPSVEIYKDSVTIEKYSNRYNYENNDHIRITSPVQESDSGNYKIMFTLDQYGQTLEKNINVKVFKPPKILPSNTTAPHFRGVKDLEATLKCNATGYPQPQILWLDAKKRNVSTVSGYHVNFLEGTLKIDRVNEQFDDGEFLCIAKNPAGSAEMPVSMAVDIRPSIVVFENKTVEEHGQVTLECRSDGKPTPKIEIRAENSKAYRNGDYHFKDEYQTMDGDIHVYMLTLKNVDRMLDVIHYCNSTNIAGSSERIGHLKVEFKPELDGTPPKQFFRQNKNREIVCHVRSYPEPTIRWYYENIQLININASIQRSPEFKTHVITMTPPSISNSYADYRCEATNKMGNSSIVIRTEYSRPPSRVFISRQEIGATWVALQFTVNDDGGEKLKNFIYEFIGRSAIINSPSIFNFTDHTFKSVLPALDGRSGPYFIRNLRPKYEYGLKVWAQNDVGIGDVGTESFMTSEPNRPNKPMINKPKSVTVSLHDIIVPSQYSNGYKLSWYEPESNGDNITKYMIEYKEADKYSLSTQNTIGEVHIIEQLRERPTFAQIGPLRPDSRYKIIIKAVNSFGESEADSILVYVDSTKPKIPEFSDALAWLANEQTPIAISLVVILLIVFMIVIDLTCCYCYQIGILYFLQNWCCPAKTNSVMSDKTYT